MRVLSLGWQTDLQLRKLEGAVIVEHDDHMIIRTPLNRSYRWGNFMLRDSPPRAGDGAQWIAQFELAFPEADYLAIGVDSPSGALGEIAELVAAGVRAETHTVMSATALRHRGTRHVGHEPPPAVFRELAGDRDWRQAIALRLALDEPKEPGYSEFIELQMRAIRDVCEAGHGAWFGAFRDDQLQSGLGVFNAGSDTARFQSVETHLAHRRQGLASNLLIAAGQYAHTKLKARTLVIAADPDYSAINIYRALGFHERERHVQLERTAT